MQENDLAYRSPPYRATQAANSLWGKNFITCEKIVRPRFICRLPVVSGIMAHSEVEIVPVLDVGILTHSQSLIPFAGIFPWTRVILNLSIKFDKNSLKTTTLLLIINVIV